MPLADLNKICTFHDSWDLEFKKQTTLLNLHLSLTLTPMTRKTVEGRLAPALIRACFSATAFLYASDASSCSTRFWSWLVLASPLNSCTLLLSLAILSFNAFDLFATKLINFFTDQPYFITNTLCISVQLPPRHECSALCIASLVGRRVAWTSNHRRQIFLQSRFLEGKSMNEFVMKLEKSVRYLHFRVLVEDLQIRAQRRFPSVVIIFVKLKVVMFREIYFKSAVIISSKIDNFKFEEWDESRKLTGVCRW